MYDAIICGARVAGSPVAMLLARKGYRVLLVDRATFPSDTLSTHYIHQPGIAALQRWGLLDSVLATNCPPITRGIIDLGPVRITGWGPAADGIADAYAPRRPLLDTVLVHAAARAGAEVREGFSIQALETENGRVTGIRGRSAAGTSATERARIIVGADGRNSFVARAVNAPVYNARPPLACYYFSYFSGMEHNHVELYPREGTAALTFPTNDGLCVVGTGWKHSEFERVRADVDGNFYGTLEAISPDLAERVRAGRREERWSGTADVPNFFRRPYGPGWALVGDAGYHKDPITGYGITDAFRDAEFLAEAIDAGLSGAAPLEEALAGYEERRNEVAMPMYDLICQMASMEAPPPDMQALFAALPGNDAATTAFFGVIDGTVTVPEFFAPEHIGSIMAAAAQRQGALA